MPCKDLCTLVVVGAMLVIAAPTVAADPPGLTPQVSFAVRHDTSIPWRDMPQQPLGSGVDRQILIRIPLNLAERAKPADVGGDPVRQSSVGIAATPSPSLSFEGLSDDDNAAVLGFRVVPPDTEGDVGANHYLQWINLILAVYDKATGEKIFGPVAGNSIWQGFGGICETNNDGDPIALYDHLVDRWVISQFAIGDDGHQCIAVSTSDDPTGSYHRYDFVVTPGGLNDYPKLGVWIDAYYMTVNEFLRVGGGFSFNGAIAVAFERDKMLQGLPAQMVKFGPLPCDTECFFSLQPSHLEGPAPAAGTPNTFIMSFDDETWGTGTNPDGYRLWEFQVDWASPSNSTFTSLGQVDAPEFDSNLCQFNPCVTQPRPGELLDSLSQFTMYRAQFRQFDTHASLLINHTVDADGRDLAGIRWAELRRDASGWFLHQTGTFAPGDGDHRWMGSLAMDQAGNIALGFSVSSRNTFPSVRYVTRLASDPLGELTGGEKELVAGSGVQQNSFNRWGDYSTMSVDPVDGCTFWYTQEYYANNGSFDFKTRIGSFVLPECTGDTGCTVTEDPEVSCSDGVDNDCDGLIDGDDPDCQAECLPTDASCTDNSQCCSGKCTGRPGAKTCK